MEGLRLADVLGKVRNKLPVSIEELGMALANEVREINERLSSLERNSGGKG